jgi:hypothetical protein
MIGSWARAAAVVGVLIACATVGMAPPVAAHAAGPGGARRVAVFTGAESLNATEARYAGRPDGERPRLVGPMLGSVPPAPLGAVSAHSIALRSRP